MIPYFILYLLIWILLIFWKQFCFYRPNSYSCKGNKQIGVSIILFIYKSNSLNPRKAKGRKKEKPTNSSSLSLGTIKYSTDQGGEVNWCSSFLNPPFASILLIISSVRQISASPDLFETGGVNILQHQNWLLPDPAPHVVSRGWAFYVRKVEWMSKLVITLLLKRGMQLDEGREIGRTEAGRTEPSTTQLP